VVWFDISNDDDMEVLKLKLNRNSTSALLVFMSRKLILSGTNMRCFIIPAIQPATSN
jgi:hypothetical protein